MGHLYKKGKEYSKREIIKAVSENPAFLADNLTVIGGEIGPRENPLWDLIGVDEDRILSLVGIRTDLSDSMLYDVLKGVEWVWEHLDIISKMFPGKNIEANQLPVVYLLAPEFTPEFKKIVTHYLDLRIKLFQFAVFENGEDNGILLEPVKLKVQNEGQFKTDRSSAQYIEMEPLVEISDEELKEFLEK